MSLTYLVVAQIGDEDFLQRWILFPSFCLCNSSSVGNFGTLWGNAANRVTDALLSVIYRRGV